MAWLSIQLKMDVIEVEGNVSIEFFGAEDNDRDGITVIESMKIGEWEWQPKMKKLKRRDECWCNHRISIFLLSPMRIYIVTLKIWQEPASAQVCIFSNNLFAMCCRNFISFIPLTITTRVNDIHSLILLTGLSNAAAIAVICLLTLIIIWTIIVTNHRLDTLILFSEPLSCDDMNSCPCNPKLCQGPWNWNWVKCIYVYKWFCFEWHSIIITNYSH